MAISIKRKREQRVSWANMWRLAFKRKEKEQRDTEIEMYCATPEQVEHWRNGGEEDTRFVGRKWQWAFCEEAHRAVCIRLRAKGLCSRTQEQWEMLLDGDKKPDFRTAYAF